MLYRGAGLRELNQNVFARERVRGEQVRVVRASMDAEAAKQGWQAQGLYNIEEHITSNEDVWETGGVTDTLPAAVKFTKDRWPPGAVVGINESAVSTPLRRIEYAPEWFDSNPGVLSHVSTLHNGELFVNGKLHGLLDVQSDKVVIQDYGRDRIENNATANRYSTERELVANEREIDLSGAIEWVAVYRGTSGTSPYTLSVSLDHSPTWRSKLGTIVDAATREVLAGSDEYRPQAEAVWNGVDELLDVDVPLYVVALESMNDVRADEGRIGAENFQFVYDGRTFDTSPTSNAHLLGGV